MRPVLSGLLLPLALGLPGADEPAAPPIDLRLVVRDLPASLTRWQATPWAKIRSALLQGPLGPQVAAGENELLARLGEALQTDPLVLLADGRRFTFSVLGRPGEKPDLRAAMSFASKAGDLFEAMKKLPGGQVGDDGAAIISEEGELRRDGDSLVFTTMAGGAPVDLEPLLARTDSDLALRFSLDRLPGVAGDTWAALGGVLGWKQFTVDGDLRLDDQGLVATALLTNLDLGGAPIDDAALTPLPGNVIALAAVGVDGKRLAANLDALAAKDASFARDWNQVNQETAAQGTPALRDVLAALAGTAYLAVHPGMPFPIVIAAFPAGGPVDDFVQGLASKAGRDLSQVREQNVPLMVPGRGGPPVPIYIRRGATHWVISNDPMGMGAIAANTPGSFADSPVAKLLHPTGGRSWAALAIDLKGAASAALGYVPMMALAVNDPEGKKVLEQVQAIGPQLAALLPPVYLRASQTTTGTQVTTANLPVLMTAFGVLGWRMQARPQPMP